MRRDSLALKAPKEEFLGGQLIERLTVSEGLYILAVLHISAFLISVFR
jgi:hypothetical protein